MAGLHLTFGEHLPAGDASDKRVVLGRVSELRAIGIGDDGLCEQVSVHEAIEDAPPAASAILELAPLVASAMKLPVTQPAQTSGGGSAPALGKEVAGQEGGARRGVCVARGGRHERVRQDTYKELLDERKTLEQQLEESALQTEAWLCDVDQLAMQCEQIVREMPPEHAPAIRALQDALLDMVADGEDADGDESSPGDDECSLCEPEPSEPSHCERVASAFFEQVAEELEWTDPTSGGSPPLAVLYTRYGHPSTHLTLSPEGSNTRLFVLGGIGKYREA
jgi:hypothetical protein